MSQTECGCVCHTDECPRYFELDSVSACSWCIGLVPGWGRCETVQSEREAEEQAVKLEYMKGKNHAET